MPKTLQKRNFPIPQFPFLRHGQIMKPLVFISAGDPLGIGPEVTVKSLKNPLVQQACSPVVIGEASSLLRAGFEEKLARFINIDVCECLQDALPGPTRAGGLCSFKAVELGAKLARQSGFALVTAPISKQSWTLADIPYTGHTEFLREQGGKEGLMMFVSGKLRCALVTEHFAIADLSSAITKKRVFHTAREFVSALMRLGIENPRVAVAALNPHAGDNGKFGTEEKKILTPVIKQLQKKGIRIEGPFPSDSLWYAHAQGKYDGILCMYHDQALAPLKIAAKEPIVHITAGLKFLRTSPTHGTAFDIAGTNQADPSSMIAAILFAAVRGKKLLSY